MRSVARYCLLLALSPMPYAPRHVSVAFQPIKNIFCELPKIIQPLQTLKEPDRVKLVGKVIVNDPVSKSRHSLNFFAKFLWQDPRIRKSQDGFRFTLPYLPESKSGGDMDANA